MIFGLVPAAGKSARMGRPKLALPLGGRTVLEHAVAALRSGGVEHVLVVIGPHVPELVPLAERAGAVPSLLDRETHDMRETVLEGLLRAEKLLRPRPQDAWLLVPGACCLAAFVWLLSLHPAAAGRTYAAYGGVYVTIAVFWLWWIDGVRPDRWDLLGAGISLLGMSLIAFGPRAR